MKLFAKKTILRIEDTVITQLTGKKGIQAIMDNIRSVNVEALLGRNEVSLNMDDVAGYIKDEVVLITGGGGSIGAELCRQIVKYQPGSLLILDIYENSVYDLQNELLPAYGDKIHIKVLIGSIRDKSRMEYIFDTYHPTVVFHAAAHKHVPLMEDNPLEAIKNNIFGTHIVAQCADQYHAKKFVLISSDKAVNPANIMGATKRIAEMIIQNINRQSETEFTAVRFGNVLGSNGSVIPLFIRQIEQGGPVTVTHPEITRYFMTIPEAVNLVLQAGGMAVGGEIFILNMGEAIKIVDLARALIKISGYKPDVDIKIQYTGLRPGEKLYEELLILDENVIATKSNRIFIEKPHETELDTGMKKLEMIRDNEYLEFIQIKKLIKEIVPNFQMELEDHEGEAP